MTSYLIGFDETAVEMGISGGGGKIETGEFKEESSPLLNTAYDLEK